MMAHGILGVGAETGTVPVGSDWIGLEAPTVPVGSDWIGVDAPTVPLGSDWIGLGTGTVPFGSACVGFEAATVPVSAGCIWVDAGAVAAPLGNMGTAPPGAPFASVWIGTGTTMTLGCTDAGAALGAACTTFQQVPGEAFAGKELG
jgi:hypothetical protein